MSDRAESTDEEDHELPGAGYVPSPLTVVLVVVTLYVWRKIQRIHRRIRLRPEGE